MVEYIAAAKALLDFWKTLRARNSVKIVVTPEGARGLAETQLNLAGRLLEDLPPITDNQIFKTLDESLRPILYFDNLRQREDVSVFYFHGLGLDQEDFYPAMMETNYHSYAPTLYGFHPSDKNPVSVPFETHCYLMAKFVESRIAESDTKKVVLVGFSTGADLLFNLHKHIVFAPEVEVGLVFLDCNVNKDTCFISRELEKALDESHSVIDLAKNIADSSVAIDDWLDMHRYLTKVLGKFKNDVKHLARLAKDICRLNNTEDVGDFVRRYRALLEWNNNVRFYFSKGEVHEKMISAILSQGEISGEGHAGRNFRWERDLSHFDLLDSDFLESTVDDALESMAK